MLAEGVEELLAASEAPLGSHELLQSLRALEVAGRKMSAIGHQLLSQCAEQGTAVALGHRRLDVLLHQLLRISKADARARIRAAQVCGPRRSFTGEPLDPVQPCTASAAHDGLIGAEHTKITSQVLGKIPTSLGAEVVAQAEEALAAYAVTMSPEQLVTVGHRLLAHLNPDGNLGDDRDRARRRSLGLGRQGVDLMSALSGTLSPSCRAKLDAVFAKLACPGAATDTADHADRPRTEVPSPAAVAADTRTQSQRNHDALEALCDLMLSSPRLGTHRGQPVTAVITMSVAELEECTGHASTASGGTLPIKDALRMAQRSHPVLVLFDHDGRPLHLGRESRLATAEQRLALFATERGCSKPGCMVPADQCQVHHTVEWNRGGRSNIDELTLACAGDHARSTLVRTDGPRSSGATRSTPAPAPGWRPPTSGGSNVRASTTPTIPPSSVVGAATDDVRSRAAAAREVPPRRYRPDTWHSLRGKRTCCRWR